MSIQTFLKSGIYKVTNQFQKRLDENFALLEARLNQLLHGGVYVLGADATTVVSIVSGNYTASGVLAASGPAFGFDEHPSFFRVDHNHTEPTGTTHWYDVEAVGHIVVNSAATVTVILRTRDVSGATSATLAQQTIEAIKTPGTDYHVYFNLRGFSELDNGDYVWITVANETNTSNLTIKSGSRLAVKGT